MIAILKRKPVIIGLIVLSVLAVAVPLVAVSAAGPFPVPGIGRPGIDVTRVQGTVVSIDAKTIVIKPATGANVTLAINGDTNFNIHGNDWLNPAALVGKTVNAVYKNGQTGTPVANEIMINMPTPPANVPMMPAIRAGALQGTITSITGSKMIVTLSAPPPAALTAGEKVGIVPAPAAVPATPPAKVITRVEGTVASVSGTELTITLAKDAGSLAKDQKVVIIPALVPGPGNIFTRVQGTVTTVTGTPVASVTITLTSGADLLKAGEPVGIIMLPTPAQVTPNVKPNLVQGKVATIAGNTVTITLANAAGSLASGQTVDIVPGMVPGPRPNMMPGNAPKPGMMPFGGPRPVPPAKL